MTKRERIANEFCRSHFVRMCQTVSGAEEHEIRADYDQLRRDALRLRAWFTRECNGLQRDEVTGKPFETIETFYGVLAGQKYGHVHYNFVPDLETPARARIAATCTRLNLWHYIQTDPRGASLYVNDVPLDDSTYNRGLCIW